MAAKKVGTFAAAMTGLSPVNYLACGGCPRGFGDPDSYQEGEVWLWIYFPWEFDSWSLLRTSK